MKTLESILEGVTSGGKWEHRGCWIDGDGWTVGVFQGGADKSNNLDAAYASRACSTWPNLIRALEKIEAAGRPHGTDRFGNYCECDCCTAFDSMVIALSKALE